MAALTALRWNPAVRVAYERPRPRGTPPKAAIGMLLTFVNAVLRDRRPWRTA